MTDTKRIGASAKPWTKAEDVWATGPVDGMGTPHPAGSYVVLGVGLGIGDPSAGEPRTNIHFQVSHGQAADLIADLAGALAGDGNGRKAGVGVALSADEREALEALCEEQAMTSDALLRQALRLYQAHVHPPVPAEPGGCMGD